MEDQKCPYNDKTIHYKSDGLFYVCNRYSQHLDRVLEGKNSKICPDPDGCERREIRINNSTHSVPLSEEV